MSMTCPNHGRSSARNKLVLLLLLSLVFSASCLSVPRQHVTRSNNNNKRSVPALGMSDVAAAELPRGGDDGEEGTATIPNEVFNLVKSIVGAGVLSLPAGIAAFGNAPSAMIPATAMIALMGGISAYTFSLIGRVCKETSTNSYSQAWDKTMGKASWLIALSCFVDCFAGNLSYSMILADTFQALGVGLGFSALTRTQALLGITSVVLLPLCFLKNLSSLAPFSLVGIAGMLYTTVAMGIRYFGGSYALPAGKFLENLAVQPLFGVKGASAVWSPRSLILACMLSNAYIAHFNAPKFFRELKNPTLGRFHQVVGWSFGASILLYAVISGLGFLTFGSASNGLILNNYSTRDVLMGFSRIAVAISIIGSYPLIFVGTRDGLLDLFNIDEKKRNAGLLNKLTLATMAVVTLLSAKLTDLGLVASVGGATFGTALVFCYPTIMFMKMRGKDSKESKIAGLICILGIIMGALGTTMAFKGVEV